VQIADHRHYGECEKREQHKKQQPTQLRHLERGSVILFGSCIDSEFALDTVFVVDRWTDHDRLNFTKLHHRVPREFWNATLTAWYKDGQAGTHKRKAGCGDGQGAPLAPKLSYRLYWGATVDKPVEGMFSYFACMPARECPSGFARPIIRLPGIIRDNLKMGYRLNKRKRLETTTVKKYWNDVRQQVESAGLWIGVGSEMPRRRTRTPAQGS
jgi:hypothetical protein